MGCPFPMTSSIMTIISEVGAEGVGPFLAATTVPRRALLLLREVAPFPALSSSVSICSFSHSCPDDSSASGSLSCSDSSREATVSGVFVR